MSLIMKRDNGVNKFYSCSNASGTYPDAYQMLAMEVVKVAASDYREELFKFKQSGVKSRECKKIEEFFRSEYGQLLSFGTGEYILETIQKEMENTDD